MTTFSPPRGVVAGEPEDVVEVRSADIDVGKDRIYRVRIIVVCHIPSAAQFFRADRQMSGGDARIRRQFTMA